MVLPFCHNAESNEHLHSIPIQGLIDEYIVFEREKREMNYVLITRTTTKTNKCADYGDAK